MKLFLTIGAVLFATNAFAAIMSDDDIKQGVMLQSKAAYHGDCMCPYMSDKAHHLCGARSAYSRPRGAKPICYDRDVTPAMMAAYRAAHGG